MALQFCDCNNLLTPVVSVSTKYHECTVCSKHFPFKKGDTLIRAPAVKPVGFEQNEHIIQYMDDIELMPTILIECPKCKRNHSKYAILGTTWYKCMYDDCRHQYQ